MEVLKRIGGVLSTALVVVAVVLAVALLGGRLLGFEAFTVLSGSMEPTYHTGSVIWVDKCDASEVEVGDPITFVMNEDLDVATHRVVSIDVETGEFTTKGDANDDVDGSPVLFENLIGVPVLSVPYLGYAISYIQGPPGCYVALIVAVAVLTLLLIPEIFDRREVKTASYAAPMQPVADSRRPRGAVSVPRGAVQNAGPVMPPVYGRAAYSQVPAVPGHAASGRVVHPQGPSGAPAYGHRPQGSSDATAHGCRPQPGAPAGVTPAPPMRPRPNAAPPQMTPEQRALYAQRELERRRSMRQAPNQGIAFDSHSNVPSGRFERREMR